MNLRRFSYGKQIKPERDWSVLIVVSSLLLAASVGGNLWLFEHVAGGGSLGDTPQESAPVFSQEALETINKIFSERASEQMKYRNGTYHFIDPSK